MVAAKNYDAAVVGAGVFGAWTALELARRGKSVVLLEAFGPGHSRSSSGDESRIIRMGYGADEIYTRWSQRSRLSAAAIAPTSTTRPSTAPSWASTASSDRGGAAGRYFPASREFACPILTPR